MNQDTPETSRKLIRENAQLRRTIYQQDRRHTFQLGAATSIGVFASGLLFHFGPILANHISNPARPHLPYKEAWQESSGDPTPPTDQNGNPLQIQDPLQIDPPEDVKKPVVRWEQAAAHQLLNARSRV